MLVIGFLCFLWSVLVVLGVVSCTRARVSREVCKNRFGQARFILE